MIDVWFSRHNDRIYVAWGLVNDAPSSKPVPIKGAPLDILRRMKKNGHEVNMVGLCPPEMIGLE